MTDYKTNTRDSSGNWWLNPLGRHTVNQEQVILQSLSRYFHGYYQLQVGSNAALLPDVIRSHKQTVMADGGDIEGGHETMPFKCHSIDTLLLCHALEFSNDPHQVLREAERILVSDGTLVLCCINPWSLWGLRRLLSWQDVPPWHGKFFSHTRIKDWLALLNFDIVAIERLMFRPPIDSDKWLTRLVSMERWGKRLWPIFSGVTIYVATKRTIPLTPVTQRWRANALFPTGRLVNKPLTREKRNG